MRRGPEIGNKKWGILNYLSAEIFNEKWENILGQRTCDSKTLGQKLGYDINIFHFLFFKKKNSYMLTFIFIF